MTVDKIRQSSSKKYIKIQIKTVMRRGDVMARIFGGTNNLEKEYKKYRNRGILFFSISVVTFIGFIPLFLMLPFIAMPLIGMVYLGSFIAGGIFLNKASIIKKGLEGERKATDIYSLLPDNYYVLTDLLISVDGQTSQIDHVVVGNNGVFVIEAKNLNGLIEGDENDTYITQHKVGRKGGEYSSQLYNPVKQVSTHVYRVSQLLKRYKIRTWIQGMVYFTNKDAEVYLQSNNIPVFASSDEGDKEIINYILNYENRNGNLNQNQKEQIVKILTKSNLNKN
jgi:hypothetical protein